MPKKEPEFYVGCFNQLLLIFLLFVIKFGHHFSFGVKNNLSIFLQIPFIIAMPLGVNKFGDSGKFICYISCLMAIGALSSSI